MNQGRMTIGEAKVLITSEAFYPRKVELWRGEIASLEHVLLTDCSSNLPPGTEDLAAALDAAPHSFETVWTGPEDMALVEGSLLPRREAWSLSSTSPVSLMPNGPPRSFVL